jgi:hypothetical protein
VTIDLVDAQFALNDFDKLSQIISSQKYKVILRGDSLKLEYLHKVYSKLKPRVDTLVVHDNFTMTAEEDDYEVSY